MVSRVSLLENLKKAELLKEKSLCSQNINNLDVWTIQQQLLNIYGEVLILDLEYALDKKVEQDLWNYCFKNYIAFLQNSTKDKKCNNSSHFQAKLAWFLECASGFYLSLLQDICTVFNLDLPFKRSDALYGVARPNPVNSKVNHPKRNSCFYICQHCLVHLGDIARYRNQMIQAESFYRQAVALGPNSGHPYNQLALLEASRGDRLSTVFQYVRSIAVAHKFPAALTNLNNTLQKCLQSHKEAGGEDGKLSCSDYEATFLRLHASLYIRQDLKLAESLIQVLGPALTPLIATQDFSSWKLVQMAVISIFVYSQIEEMKEEVQQVMAEFLTGYLTALLLPLYTMSADSVLDYFGLPTIKMLMGWMKCEKGLVERLSKQHLWRGVCKLLNELRASHSLVPVNCINDALPEDYDLRGFLPLDSVLNNLNFEGEELDNDIEKRLRSFRLIKLGEWLALNSSCKPIFISDTGLFEIVPMVVNEKPGIQFQKSGHITSDVSKPRTRPNIALQSILRLSNGNGEEGNTCWEPSSRSSLMSADARWWPPGPPIEELPTWSSGPDINNQESGGMYSLFSGGVDVQPLTSLTSSNSLLKHQSLWSGPGPSPLERLLEQQKTQRMPHGPDT